MSTNIEIVLTGSQIARIDKASCELDLPLEAVATTLIEEGLRMREFRGIHFRDVGTRETGISREAFVPGTRIAVFFLAELAREVDNDIATIAEFYGISHADVKTSLDYINAYPDEIDRAIAANEAAYDALVASLSPDRIVNVQ